MKRIWTVLGIAFLALAVGTGVYAATDEAGSFKDMLPFMKGMHPNTSERQLEHMYYDCHRDGRGMPGMMHGNRGSNF